MLRRRAAATARRCLQGGADGSSSSSGSLHAASSMRWWHGARSGGLAAPAAPAAARPALRHRAAVATGSGFRSQMAAAWRQQVRQQWNDGRGYQHFGGRGRPEVAVLYSRDARGRWLRVLAVVGVGGGLVWASGRQEVPYTLRSHSILVGPQAELDMGKQVYQQVIAEAKASRTLLPPQHRASQLVRRVGTRVAKAATDGYGGGFQGHLRGLQWEFAVIDSPQVNAFVVPGGKVVVYTGLLGLVRSEDELASVLAHECAHVVARHGAERLTQQGLTEAARLLAYWMFGLPIPSGALSAVFFLPNSRKAETEADVIGVQVMARACYDPAAMISMFQKLGAAEAREGGSAMPKFLRTHPHSSDRVKAIQRMMPTAEGLFESSGCGDAQRGLAAFKGLWRSAP